MNEGQKSKKYLNILKANANAYCHRVLSICVVIYGNHIASKNRGTNRQREIGCEAVESVSQRIGPAE